MYLIQGLHRVVLISIIYASKDIEPAVIVFLCTPYTRRESRGTVGRSLRSGPVKERTQQAVSQSLAGLRSSTRSPTKRERADPLVRRSAQFYDSYLQQWGSILIK